jgi:hypothetical protein
MRRQSRVAHVQPLSQLRETLWLARFPPIVLAGVLDTTRALRWRFPPVESTQMPR